MNTIDLENLFQKLRNKGSITKLPESGTYKVKVSPQQAKESMACGLLVPGDDSTLRIHDKFFKKEK